MQFGKLTNYESMEKYFHEMKAVSRTELLNRIYKRSGTETQHKIEAELTETFVTILQHDDFFVHSPASKEILKIFNIKPGQLDYKTPEQKRQHLQKKIRDEIEQCIPREIENEKEVEYACNLNQQSNSEFEWVGVKSKFPGLRGIFQEILLEKVRMFDDELTRITELNQSQRNKKQETISTARTLAKRSRTLKTEGSPRYVSKSPANIRTKRMQSNLEKKGFSNVLIRDHSEFTLNKWGRQQEREFQDKVMEFRDDFNINGKKSPIIFQFVKKYTQTIKARDNIYLKWERGQTTPEELRYLCSTSLFLNKTLNESQKLRLKHNIGLLGKELISKLEFNIAEKIIETYKQFMKKVSDLRAHYYLEMTEKRKAEQSIQNGKRSDVDRKRANRKEFQRFRSIFRNICKSEKMKVMLNPKIYRWVKLFITNFKANSERKLGRKYDQIVKLSVFNRLSGNGNLSSLLMRTKMKCPSSRILKREEHTGYRHNTKTHIPSTRFEYSNSFERHIRQFNQIKVKSQKSYIGQLTGGPPKDRKEEIIVDTGTKQIIATSSSCVRAVILIQAKWRMIYNRKIYLKRIQNERIKLQNDFEQRKESLFLIYPENKRIDLKAIQDRIKRVSMRTLNVFKPYSRVIRKPINLYTSFSRIELSLNEFRLKNANSRRRMAEFQKMVQLNQYRKLVKSGLVLTAKQINEAMFENGASAIWWAVKNSNAQLTKKFLEGGGNPNCTDNDGNSCLHSAIQNGILPIIFELLDFGADLNVKNNKNCTPLYFATPNMLKLLGLEEGSVNGDASSFIDNNSLFFNPETVNDIYPEHCY